MELEKQPTQPKDEKIQSKWTQFFKIGNLFRNPTLTSEQSSQNDEKKKLTLEVDKLIQANMYSLVFKMVNSGYVLSKKQYNQIKELVDKNFDFSDYKEHGYVDIHSVHSLDKIESWINLGWKLTQEQALFLVSSSYFRKHVNDYIFFNQPVRMHQNLVAEIITFIDQESFQKAYFEHWKKMVISSSSHYTNLENIYTTLEKYHEYLFKSINNISEFIDICDLYAKKLHLVDNYLKDNKHIYGFPGLIIEHRIESRIEFMESLVNTYFPDGVNKLVENTVQVFSKDKIENLTTKLLQNNSAHLNQLPEDANKILNNIGIKHQELLKNLDMLNENEKFEINNLIENKLPVILNGYFSVNEIFRTTMTNKDGKNTVELTILSLANIESYFDQLVEEVNQNKVNSLSATEKYTRNFKKT